MVARHSRSLSDLVRRRLAAHLEGMPARPTQSAIADALGVTQTWVSHYFRGRHDVDLDTLAKLADFLGVRLESLVADSENAKAVSAHPAGFGEVWTLLQSVTPAERDVVRDVLRVVARRPASKRARV
jgi:hypothetical protein